MSLRFVAVYGVACQVLELHHLQVHSSITALVYSYSTPMPSRQHTHRDTAWQVTPFSLSLIRASYTHKPNYTVYVRNNKCAQRARFACAKNPWNPVFECRLGQQPSRNASSGFDFDPPRDPNPNPPLLHRQVRLPLPRSRRGWLARILCRLH